MKKGKMTCVKDFFMDNGDLAFKKGVEYVYKIDATCIYCFKSLVTDGFGHYMRGVELQEAFGTQGEVSKSMNIQTRPAHRFEINGYWVMVDSKMPTSEFNHIKNELIDYYDMMKILNKQK
jgi:hypothetical protein